MVSWRLVSSSAQPNRDPWGRAEARFADGSTVTLVYRGTETPEHGGTRRRYAYSITQPKLPRTVTAGTIGSAVGDAVDFTRTLRALVSFLGADADRYEYAQRHGGEHPDGGPLDPVEEWAAEHTDELDTLAHNLEHDHTTGQSAATASRVDR
jgi:hypothetical protein